jgi:hypothetical protein
MNRVEMSCDVCKHSYVVSANHRHAKKCRVCEAIAADQGLDVDTPEKESKLQAMIDRAVAQAVAATEARYAKDYDPKAPSVPDGGRVKPKGPDPMKPRAARARKSGTAADVTVPTDKEIEAKAEAPE